MVEAFWESLVMNWRTYIVIWLTRIFCAACGVALCAVLVSFGMRFLIGGLALCGLYVSLVFLHQLKLSRTRLQQGCAEILDRNDLDWNPDEIAQLTYLAGRGPKPRKVREPRARLEVAEPLARCQSGLGGTVFLCLYVCGVALTVLWFVAHWH
jgi:hypothetical protein